MVYISRLKKFITEQREKNARYLTAVALIAGFIVDLFTLNRIDQVFDNAVLIIHLLIVGTSIVIRHTGHTLRLPFEKSLRLQKIADFLIPFSLGGLFSGFVIFYTKSAALLASWPFLLILVAFLVGSEVFKQYLQRFVLQVSVYYVAVFLYLIFFIPLITNEIGDSVFIVSGVISLIYITIFVRLIRRINRVALFRRKRILTAAIGSIFVIINLFYFTNLIPPVPLSLKFLAPYHTVERNKDGSYTATYEATARWNIIRKRSRQLDRTSGQPVTVFSAIFAPADLSTTIYHQWQEKIDGKWVNRDRIAIPINGGRDEGYRGFSRKHNIASGRWRVRVETERGQRLGVMAFTIMMTDESVEFVTEEL